MNTEVLVHEIITRLFQ